MQRDDCHLLFLCTVKQEHRLILISETLGPPSPLVSCVGVRAVPRGREERVDEALLLGLLLPPALLCPCCDRTIPVLVLQQRRAPR